MCGAVDIQDISVTSSFCCEPKTTLKAKPILKHNHSAIIKGGRLVPLTGTIIEAVRFVL